jgi:hypothetical protein
MSGKEHMCLVQVLSQKLLREKKNTLESDGHRGSHITSKFCLPNDRPGDKIHLISYASNGNNQ